MDAPDINSIIESAFLRLAAHLAYGQYVDTSLPIPQAFIGSGTIRLIILGQDPTVKNAAARKSITTVLNLNKSGTLRTYLLKICATLDINLSQEVYATNLFKNFFIQQPTQITELDIFDECLPFWLPVLQAELAQLPTTPVLILGEPLLQTLVCGGASGKVRDYWGYVPGWKQNVDQPLFSRLPADHNLLERTIFPFPHQPSWQRQKFYSGRLEGYCKAIRKYLNSQA